MIILYNGFDKVICVGEFDKVLKVKEALYPDEGYLEESSEQWGAAELLERLNSGFKFYTVCFNDDNTVAATYKSFHQRHEVNRVTVREGERNADVMAESEEMAISLAVKLIKKTNKD